jgi:hypothetical protein
MQFAVSAIAKLQVVDRDCVVSYTHIDPYVVEYRELYRRVRTVDGCAVQTRYLYHFGSHLLDRDLVALPVTFDSQVTWISRVEADLDIPGHQGTGLKRFETRNSAAMRAVAGHPVFS